jgi:hypothetical protein
MTMKGRWNDKVKKVVVVKVTVMASLTGSAMAYERMGGNE